MKKFAIRLVIFAIIAVTIDVCIGNAFSKIREMNRAGDVYRISYIMNEMNDKIIIMGSSRAVHHYDPFLIEDSTGMTCQNCGFDGNGIIMEYALWKEISKRYYPKVIIYDVMAAFDLSSEYDNHHRFLSRLKPFYRSNSLIDSVFWDVDMKEQIKMMSQTYQYNSNCMDILAGWLHPLWTDNGKGYKPASGTIDTTAVTTDKSIGANKKIIIDRLKLGYFKKLIDETKGKTKLIFVVSPLFRCGCDTESYKLIKSICYNNGIQFIDYSSDKDFVGNRKLFHDNLHLNKVGATVFTQKIIQSIKIDLK